MAVTREEDEGVELADLSLVSCALHRLVALCSIGLFGHQSMFFLAVGCTHWEHPSFVREGVSDILSAAGFHRWLPMLLLVGSRSVNGATGYSVRRLKLMFERCSANHLPHPVCCRWAR